MRYCRWGAALLGAVLLLTGCGSDKNAAELISSEGAGKAPASDQIESYKSSDDNAGTVYEPPEAVWSIFDETQAEGNDVVRLDMSQSSYGYFGIRVFSESKIKVKVEKDEDAYIYTVPSDGTTAFMPLQCGSGLYKVRVMENVVDTKYAAIYETEASVTVTDEFAPYLRPSLYINYSPDSLCTRKAAELAEGAPDALGVVTAVFDYICGAIIYDKEKAASVKYLEPSDIDRTLTEGKGICSDYASLAAAMLRSQGIPTKMIFGYVSPDDIYHAWNMFYTEETGWVTVGYQVSGDSWNRLDLTFSANGTDGEFIGDGTHYADVYYY